MRKYNRSTFGPEVTPTDLDEFDYLWERGMVYSIDKPGPTTIWLIAKLLERIEVLEERLGIK